MDNKQSAEIGFVGGFGMLLIGLVLPMMLPMLPTFIQYCIFFVGVALILMSLAAICWPDFFIKSNSAPKQKTFEQVAEKFYPKPNIFQQLFPSRLIPMRDAGKHLYTDARTGNARYLSSLLDAFSEEVANEGKDRTDYIMNTAAEYISQTSIPIYGKHPPSDKFEQIDKNLLPQMRFCAFATELRKYGKIHAEFTEISINRSDLAKASQEIRGPFIKAKRDMDEIHNDKSKES